MRKNTPKKSKARCLAFIGWTLLLAIGFLALGQRSSIYADSLGEGVMNGLERPVVVELFTSEGCSSCPPADRFAGELAAMPGVLPLSFHVDYWDYIGWRDPFAAPLYSDRQRDYAHELALRYVYTPQMVVDGRYDVVGFRRDEVFAAIEQAAAKQTGPVMTIDPVSARLSVPVGTAPAEGATLWLALYDSRHSTDVPRGENAGRKLMHYNVVRALRPLGTWNGEALEIPLDLSADDENDGCVVLLQAGKGGPILSAVAMPLPAS